MTTPTFQEAMEGKAEGIMQRLLKRLLNGPSSSKLLTTTAASRMKHGQVAYLFLLNATLDVAMRKNADHERELAMAMLRTGILIGAGIRNGLVLDGDLVDGVEAFLQNASDTHRE